MTLPPPSGPASEPPSEPPTGPPSGPPTGPPTGRPDCCREYDAADRRTRLTRRRLLQGAGATALAATTFGGAFRQTSFAATTGGNVLVVLSLRGGVDGMGVVVPHGDPGYYAARPALAVPREALIARDDMFGLHPSMAPLQWAWDGGELAAVHAVGTPAPNRSHFSAMEEVEDADPGSSVRRGWVNRMVGLTSRTDPTEAVHLSSAIVPTLLSGPAPVLAADAVTDISLVGAGPDDEEFAERRRAQLDLMWGGGEGVPIFDAYRSARRTVDAMAPVASQPYTPADGVTYPDAWPASDLAAALRDTAHLIKADVGTEVVSIDYGSWDMHSDYGTTEWGEMQSMLGGLAAVLSAFLRDLGPDLRSRVTVVTISEFGRRLMENGNRGLDHGWGSMMLLAGGGVAGGRYHARWPGLGDGRQGDADLAVTTDYRDVLGEIVAGRFPTGRSRTSSRGSPRHPSGCSVGESRRPAAGPSHRSCRPPSPPGSYRYLYPGHRPYIGHSGHMSPAPTRRRLMAGSAAVTATVAVSGLLESPASAATTSTAATTAATRPPPRPPPRRRTRSTRSPPPRCRPRPSCTTSTASAAASRAPRSPTCARPAGRRAGSSSSSPPSP